MPSYIKILTISFVVILVVLVILYSINAFNSNSLTFVDATWFKIIYALIDIIAAIMLIYFAYFKPKSKLLSLL